MEVRCSASGSGGYTQSYVPLLRVIFSMISNHIISQIPLYAFYKIWTSFLGPMYFNRAKGDEGADSTTAEPTSKRQQKLKKREEKGDSRVKRVQVKR